MLVEATHILPKHLLRHRLRFTDTRIDEADRGLSLKSMPVSLVLPSHRGKSYLFNFIDTPGKTARAPRVHVWALGNRKHVTVLLVTVAFAAVLVAAYGDGAC